MPQDSRFVLLAGLVSQPHTKTRWRGSDHSPYGKAVADEVRRALKAAGLAEAFDDEYGAGEKDYSALVSKLKNARIDVLYVGGYVSEVGLITRQMRDQGLKTQVIAADALITDEYWKIAGDAGEGTMMTFLPDPRKNPAAAAVVKEFQNKNIDPEGYVLYTYAAVQVWAQAATKANSADFDKVIGALKDTTFDTVLGPIKFNAKGDVVKQAYVFYVWHHGRYGEM